MADYYIEFAEQDSRLNPESLPEGLIHWSQAREHIGELVRVYGEVADTYFDWDEYERYVGYPEVEVEPPPTFLEIGAKFPNKERLRVVIWGRDWNKFKRPPDKQFENTVIVITGIPYLYKDMVHIQVSGPEGITKTTPIENIYVSPNYAKLLGIYGRTKPVFPRALARAERERRRRMYERWEDADLYDGGDYTVNEWGEPVEVVSIPGTNSTMYFDEDNGWIVD